jgi:hypothetical protein
MKACKLCEISDHHQQQQQQQQQQQHKEASLNSNGSDGDAKKPQLCRHSSADALTNTFNLLPSQLRDMFLAAQILRGERS